MRQRLGRLLVTFAATATLLGGVVLAAPAANAASCGSFDGVTSCISNSGGYIDSSESLSFRSIPAGCVASISLYKVINGEGFPEITIHDRCVIGHVGDLFTPIHLVGNGTFYTVACANWNTGGACAYSPFMTT